MSFEDVLSRIPGLGGYLAKEQYNRQQSMGDLQSMHAMQGVLQQANAFKANEAAKGILASDAPDEVKIKGLLGLGAPGVQMANQLAVMQEHQQKVAKEKRVNDFWANEAPKFNTPATPALAGNVTPGEGLTKPTGSLMSFSSGTAEDDGPQGILSPAKPAGVDFEGMLNRAAQVGAVPPETLVNHRAQQQERAAARQDRMIALQMQIDERVQRGQDAADLRRELADQANQSRQDAIRLAASLRPEPQQRNIQTVETASGLSRMNPDGSLTPIIDPATGKQAQGRSNLTFDKGTQARAMELRTKFDANPEVKRVNALESTIVPVANYMKQFAETGKMNPTADLALTNAFLAATHPKGDQIGVRDRAEITKLGDIGGRIGNGIESFLSGKNLPDDVRADMWREVANRYKTLKEQKTKLRDDVLKRAESMKVPAEYIFPE